MGTSILSFWFNGLRWKSAKIAFCQYYVVGVNRIGKEPNGLMYGGFHDHRPHGQGHPRLQG
ncbi:MAG: hypothetical protein WCI75_10080, partial [candidate division NC10 bacterium]